ncbi:hypothetical protein COW91_01185 [Candidatus Nomurabacteria bacterium CG22_combo_CG10-13_8_21_14_all_32_8]|uniref:L-lactate permease n=2 Tax=Candidatus Nomuraibacteriota TaxID=1752729 RepID=A0A2H0CGP7_9BACT|nr:MAG: hypothetical protein COW91_01185 [Candidatus Nomurabacteria bacterium CG22_combo_CG10-13_8_21_14_all_32_8]PIZ85536.1 MAG: hypothetical protein COX94_02550 [Candidatus Nomurabacteria bacterium CG_4_10_14_0_2_um_filter_33_9]
MCYLPLILSVTPFLIFLFLLLIKKTSLLRASFYASLSCLALMILFWQMDAYFLYVSVGKAVFIALDIFIIIFGAIFFLEILEDLKIIKNISYYLEGFSKDYRVQVIVLAWLFSSFIEGTAGFGTPAAIVVPLLIGIGLTPIKSLVVGLLGNSTAGVFGAAGTPIRIGFSGLDTALVPITASLINLVGFIVPIFMLWIITSGRENRKKEFLDALPFAIWAGVAFVLPSILFVSLGQEFPSILGSIVGLILVVISTKLNIFNPKTEIKLEEEKEVYHTMSAFKSFLPYGILIVLLVLGKFILSKLSIPIFAGFSHTFNLFNPGFAFILTGIIVYFIWKKKSGVFIDSIKTGFKGAWGPFLVIISMLSVVQLMIYSGNNSSGVDSSINLITKIFGTPLLPIFAPFVGAFGAFMTGSVTISNIMFGNFFNTASLNLGFNQAIILSLLVVGAAAGNMVALADILAAEAVARVKNYERKILKGVIVPCLIYLSLVALIGFLIF